MLLAAAPLRADVAERDWPETPSATVEGSGGAASRPSLNITQPKIQVDQPAYLLAPKDGANVKPTATKRKKAVRRKSNSSKKARKTTSRKRNDREALEAWWSETGNPVVLGFSRCLRHHAERYRQLAGPAPARIQIARAMDGDCRNEFDEMAKAIANRFGRDGFERLSEELIQTTFIPAVERDQ